MENLNGKSAMRDTGLVSITDVELKKSAGAVVWWRLCWGLDGAALLRAWTDEQLPISLIPEYPSFVTALRRSVNDLVEKRLLARPCPSGGIALVEETTSTSETLHYEIILTVAHAGMGNLQFSESTHPRSSELTDLIRAGYARHLRTYSQQDVSAWLCRMLDKQIEAVALRDSGGIYFVPAYRVPLWERIVRAIRAASDHVVHFVPAMPSGETISAITDAIAQEVNASVATLEPSDDVGARGLASRYAKASELEEKVKRYEQLLGTSLAKTRARVEVLQAELFAAQTAIEVEKNGGVLPELGA